MKLRVALSVVFVVSFAACVGDDNIVNDGGPDVTVDSPTSDASDASTDGGVKEAAIDTGPPIDGGYAFSANWDTFSNSGNGADSVATMPAGGWVIGGSYSSSVTVIGAYGLPTATGVRDAYVATVDNAGKVTGALGFGGAGSDDVLAVAADTTGIYIAGVTLSGGTLNGKTLTSGTFIAKLDPTNLAAAPKWTRSFEFSGACSSCLAVRGSKVVYGATFGIFGINTLNYDTSKSITTNGGEDIFLLELDTTTGVPSWASQIGGTSDDALGGIALDGAGALYIVGDFKSNPLTGGQALGAKNPVGPGSTDNMIVAKIDASHAAQYAYAYGDPGGQTIVGGGIAPDGAGHVAVGGVFSGGVNFGMGVSGAASSDGILFVIDESQSKTVWQQVIGDTGGDRVNAVAFDPWGHLLATGSYQKTPTIGSLAKLANAGTSLGAYLAKFGPSPTFTPEWAVGFVQGVDGGSITSIDLAIAPSGTSIFCGGFSGSTDLGNGPITQISNAGTADTWIAGRLP